ncbi:MAG: hypothetical protein AB7J13_17345 [Pyrinomonadaceae bacterium]
MKLTSLLILLITFFTAAQGQSPSKTLDRANKALGGEKRLKGISTRRMSGAITRLSDGASGRYSISASDGGNYREAFDLNGFEIASAYNGKSGWIRDSRAGLRTVTGDAARDFQAEALFRNTLWLRAKDQKAKIVSAGATTVGGAAANALWLTTAKGSRISVYFDKASGLPIRFELPRGVETRTYDLGDYRPVDGIQTPFSVRLTSEGQTYEIKIDNVGYDQIVASSTYDFPVVSAEALPDISTLLSEVRANADKVDEILENYSYTETRIERDLDKNGGFVEKSSEKRSLTFFKGYRITRTIEKNGKPLSPSDQAREDKEAEKQVAEIEKRIAERQRKEIAARDTGSGAVGRPTGEGQRITIADALKGSLLINPRRERFRGRDVIVFDYEPDPAFKPKTRNEKLFALCNGAVWVDAVTKQVVRLEAALTESTGNFLAKAKKGASFTLENELVNNEIWLPSRADINVQIKILFFGIDINNLIKYGDYRRFETEVKDATVGGEDKPIQ